MKRAMFSLLAILLGVGVAAAEPATLVGSCEQGGLVIGLVRPGATVSLDGRPVMVAPDGRFLLGFGRDAAVQATLVVDGAVQRLTVTPRPWIVQRINGLPQAKVTPDPATLARIQAENARIVQARQRLTSRPHWQGGAVWPAEGPVSGVFGSQRVLNGTPRAPHSGTDIAAPAGSPVVAMADGAVSLVHPDMVLTGNTVMIDHGFGLQSVYAHMADILVREGEPVRKGQVIGHVGATGRATGPHLHFGVTLFDGKLDPERVLAVLGG